MKKKMSQALGFLLALTVVMGQTISIPAFAAESKLKSSLSEDHSAIPPSSNSTNLITPDCKVTVSSEADPSAPSAHLAVDGDIAAPSQWASEPMKNETASDQTHTPQWLVVDLGENVTAPIDIEQVKLYFDAETRPMVYEIQTSAANDESASWNRLVRIERNSSFSDESKNGSNQNVMDKEASADIITKTSTPALEANAAVQRYIRLYVEKADAFAPKNNICLREIQVFAKAPQEPSEIPSESIEDPLDQLDGSELPKPTGKLYNLALNQDAEASGCMDNTVPGNAVDGSASTRWNSENLKSFVAQDNSKDKEEQNHQWIQIDLGVTGSVIDQIKIGYAAKVWAMEYEIQTTDTPDVAASWETVVRVERPSAFDNVTNGDKQDIANTAENTDTITTKTSPALQQTVLKRYVRMYIYKTNTRAPGGHNVNITEIEIQGNNPNLAPPLNTSMQNVQVDDPAAGDTQIKLPAVNVYNLYIRGSTLENVVSNDGKISTWNIGPRDVDLLLRMEQPDDKTKYVEKNVSVTVPDHRGNYPSEWFPAVSTPNPKPEVIPSVQEWYGYENNFTLTANSKIVINDAADVGLQKVAASMKTDVLEISGIDLPVVEGTSTGPNDIYIESLTDSNAYDLGNEGYLMITDESGLRIYAPTYIGCLYGTITAEQILWQAADHVSIPMGIMRDYPAFAVRGLMLDIARTPFRYQQLQDYARIMRWYKMSEYHLHISDNDNSNIDGASFDTHAGFHRLESENFPSLKSEVKHAGIPQDLVNADYYENNPDYQGNPTYTKEQWRALADLCKDNGMYMVTELDMPGHSLLYNKYAKNNPDDIDWLRDGGIMLDSKSTTNSGYQELLDLVGDNKNRAWRFATALWDEYTNGSDPVISGPVVHIGADEYWIDGNNVKTAFAQFADDMRKVIQKNLGQDVKIRMWGAGTGKFSTASAVLNMTTDQLAEQYQLDIWTPHYDDAAKRTAEGFKVINARDAFLYGNPGRQKRDVPNAEYLFHDWNPSMFGGGDTKLGEPNLDGAKAVIWGDQSQEGMTERDIHQRVLRAIAIVSEKTWGGTDDNDTFTAYELRASRLAEGPGTQIAMKIDSASSLVLDYDFTNLSSDRKTVYDASGNGYDATLTGGSVTDGWLTFDGNSLMQTPLKTLSYPYTVSFDLKLSAEDGQANTAESSLFSGYDGRIQVAGHEGRLSADVNYFTRDFDYTVPTNEKPVNITLVGTFQSTRLYVNGNLVTFLSQKENGDGLNPGAITTLYSSVLLPLKKIGQNFHGQMANIKVYNKALSAQEIADAMAGQDDGLVNVAQNTSAGGNAYKSGENQDDGVQRTCIAMKAVDGEAFTDDANDTSSEIYSYWNGDYNDSSLTVDLGQVRTVSQVQIQWRSNGVGKDFQIKTSMDGKQWDVAEQITGNQAARTTIPMSTPVQARYVKMEGIAQNNNPYMIQEFLVYEQVDKSALIELLDKGEAMVEQKHLSFESDKQELFRAVVFARAMRKSPLATQTEVDKACENLRTAMEDPGGSGSGGAAGGGTTIGQMNPDGSITYVEKKTDGTTITTTKYPDGTVQKVETKKDGTTITTTTTANGTVGKVVENANGDITEVSGQVSSKDAENAKETGNPVKIPVKVPVSSTIAQAPDIKVDVPTGGAKVEIPVDHITSGTVAIIVHTDGTTEVVKKSGLTKEGVSLTLDKGVTLKVVDNSKAFNDVKAVNWYKNAVDFICARELMKGTSAQTFSPDTSLSRGMLAVIIHNMENNPTAEQHGNINDIKGDEWYAQAVYWAVEQGILSGYEDGNMRPNDRITREQLAVMLYRYAGSPATDYTLSEFNDSQNISSYATSATAWAVQNGVMNGKGKNTLDPKGQATRAETAQMLMNFMG